MRIWVQSLALPSGLRIPHCHKLWAWVEDAIWDLVLLWLWCGLAAATQIQPPSLGTALCHGCDPKIPPPGLETAINHQSNQKKKKKKKKKPKNKKGCDSEIDIIEFKPWYLYQRVIKYNMII